MTPAQSTKLRHLEWAVESRARNQRCAVGLLRLFTEYEDQWKTQKWSRAAQDLLSVSFSLWRAAFLADKSGQRRAVFSDAMEFLEKIIEDNAISYAQDRKCKEWTFNYYTRNARASLEMLVKYWPEQVSAYAGRKRTSTERWDYCQELLGNAVTQFEKLAREMRARRVARTQAKEIRLAAKRRKSMSRKITLAARNVKPTS
jgi:hypothetical protein